MKRKTSLLCALLLAVISIGAFMFVFPAGQSTMPAKRSAQDTEQTQLVAAGIDRAGDRIAHRVRGRRGPAGHTSDGWHHREEDARGKGRADVLGALSGHRCGRTDRPV